MLSNKQLLIKKLLEIKQIDDWKNYQLCIWHKNGIDKYVFDFFIDGKNLLQNRFFHPILTTKFLLENIEEKNYFLRKSSEDITKE